MKYNFKLKKKNEHMCSSNCSLLQLSKNDHYTLIEYQGLYCNINIYIKKGYVWSLCMMGTLLSYDHNMICNMQMIQYIGKQYIINI